MRIINRREFLTRSAQASCALGLATRLSTSARAAHERLAYGETSTSRSPTAAASSTLPGTAPLMIQGDFAAQMVDGIHSFLQRRTEEAVREREKLWKRDFRSVEAYNRSVSPNRERFRRIIGALDARAETTELEVDAGISSLAPISRGEGYAVFAVRWQTLKPVIPEEDLTLGAEGLLLEPDGPPVARIVAIPDADWSPEMLVGLAPGAPPAAQFARRLAENGCQVVIPALINRSDDWSGLEGVLMTNQPHREYIYRMAFEVGRHIIGYEVQKVLAAIDWFAAENGRRRAPIGVIGYGEGGLLALCSAAVDLRIEAAVVSGYFQPREEVWKEPIYRDVWGLVREFGDAELAGLIVPRALIVEASRGPEVDGPPPAPRELGAQSPTVRIADDACPNGKLVTPPLHLVQKEVDRARPFFAGLGAAQKLQLVVSDDGQGLPGSEAVLRALLRSLGGNANLLAARNPPTDGRLSYDPKPRLHRQFSQLIAFTQSLVRNSPERRADFWSKADASSIERWKQTAGFYRDYIWDEVIGRLPPPNVPANPRTRLVYDEPKFLGYEVMLDVWPDVFAYGILLLPKDIKPGERRPVVVCQHGLEGRPSEVSDPKIDSPFYHRFAVQLANEGFVTYAPQNPYIGHDRFRLIQRKGHPLKLSLFSFILGQHQRTLEWLAGQPFVDPDRIGFYGLSYGGKTAVRVPPLLERYALSICSADFDEWVWKVTSDHSRYSYLLTPEYDMIEFDFANVCNYAELANLMAPRPFMVERGSRDGVAPDEWVAYEYAKVRRFYANLGIPDNTSIEFFNGPHSIHGVGTFEFLRRHLRLHKEVFATSLCRAEC